ncbi:MAG: hypothetical protein HOD92_24555, partial [Deltaproteobacteria bacterium]|nr:hypothetical protein [Deltaproteobacteria bacterium]
MFKMFFQMIFIFVLMMSFSACSDDGDDSSGTGSSVGSSSSEVATLANSTGSIAENAADGDTVGNLTISSTGDTAITAITLSGTGSGDFQVSTGGEITVATGAAIDYEVIPVYNLTAVATNTVGNSASVDVTISVSDFENLFQTAIIRADDAQVEDAFGKATAVSGNYMVVGVQYEDTGGQTTGSAYVFKKQSDGSLMQIAKIQANDAAANDNFGESVTINGDYIVVGAPREDTTGSDAGSVYLFRRNSDSTDDVTQIAKFQADDAASGTYFGNSVAMVGDYVVVGAEQANSSGSAYLFKRNSDTTDDVTQLAKIQPSDGEATDYFGSSVAVSGNYIIVGAYAEDTNGSMAGSAYLFKRNSDATDDVTQLAKIQPNDVEAGDYFGYSVAISGDYVVVGAYLEDTSGSNAGSVYLFKRNS